MKQGKGAAGFLQALAPEATSLYAVAEPGQHLAMPVGAIITASAGLALPGPDVAQTLAALAATASGPARVLICGSLYLAGEVLKADAVGEGATG
jgi:dihydrofolate synthase/folylpolyglutamate synthase